MIEIHTLIDEKRRVVASYRPLHTLRAARNKVKQISRRCANDIWLQLCNLTQVCIDTGNLKSMYDGIKHAIGPMQSRTAHLKSATGDIIKNKSKQMERWMDHYSELYSRMNVVSEETVIDMESWSTMDELDSEPTLEEVNQARDQPSSGKAPGNDGIPAEVIKCAKETLLKELHEILCQYWREGEVSQDMRDAKIVTVYKNKGDKVTVTITMASLSSTSLANSLPKLS